jgi:hypothetical protein
MTRNHVTDEQVHRFSALFKGSSTCHGRTIIGEWDESTKKCKAECSTSKGEATFDDYKAHLEGRIGLGISPLLEDSNCWFAAIDIDDKSETILEDIAAKIERQNAIGQNLPFVFCQSKSNRPHLYIFAREPIAAKFLQLNLRAFAEAIGQRKAEIFPKQHTHKDGQKTSWINLPYFGEARPAVVDGVKLSLEEFLDHAESKRVTKAAMEVVTIPPIMGCEFIQYCCDSPEDINYDLWFSLSTITGALGDPELFHNISAQDGARYDHIKTQCQYEASTAKDESMPVRCDTLAQKGFTCPKMAADGTCSIYKVKSPAGIGKQKSTKIDDPEGAWPDPIDFRQISTPVPEFPQNFLPGEFGNYANNAAYRLSVLREFTAIPLIIAFATALGSKVVLQPKQFDTTWVERACLWGMVISPPGYKKSPSWKEATAPLTQIQKRFDATYKKDMLEYEHDQQAYKAQGNKKKLPPPEKPIHRKVLENEPTVEGLSKAIRDNTNGILLLRDELSGFLLSMDQYKSGKGDLGFYLECWSGGRWSSTRKSAESIYIDDLYLNIFGTIQPEKARELFSNTDDGMTARFGLMAYPDENYRDWVDDAADLQAQKALCEYFDAILNCFYPPATPQHLKMEQDDDEPI